MEIWKKTIEHSFKPLSHPKAFKEKGEGVQDSQGTGQAVREPS
jgi:hypothetical protein